MAPQYEKIRGELRAELARLRDEHHDGKQHSRTPANLAHLVLGWRYFLRFAAEAGAVDVTERRTLEARVAAADRDLGEVQGRHHRDAEPAAQFLRLLRSCLVSGRAHVAGPKGEELGNHSQVWGWRPRTVGTGEDAHAEWQPQGRRLGWLDGEHLYLDPEAAHGEAQKFATEKGESLTVSSRTLGKRLHEQGLLASMDKTRDTLTVRRTLEGARREVWHLPARGFFSALEPDQPDQPDRGETQAGGCGQVPGSGPWSENRPAGENPTTETDQNPEENGPLVRLVRSREGGEGPGEPETTLGGTSSDRADDSELL